MALDMLRASDKGPRGGRKILITELSCFVKHIRTDVTMTGAKRRIV